MLEVRVVLYTSLHGNLALIYFSTLILLVVEFKYAVQFDSSILDIRLK